MHTSFERSQSIAFNRSEHTGTRSFALSERSVIQPLEQFANRIIQIRQPKKLLVKLQGEIAARNELVKNKPRCQPEAGQRKLQGWAAQHKPKDLVELKLDGRTLVLERHRAAIEKSLELTGCYVVTTDVLKPNMSAQEVHDIYVSLQKVERDFRAMKTGLLEVRPLFLRKESRTRGHAFCCMLALKLSRAMERRLQKQFGTTDSNPHAITLRDALASLGSLCLLQYKIDEKTTVTKLPQPSANQTKILAALGVTLPAKM